jgi:hypothetical protein
VPKFWITAPPCDDKSPAIRASKADRAMTHDTPRERGFIDAFHIFGALTSYDAISLGYPRA